MERQWGAASRVSKRTVGPSIKYISTFFEGGVKKMRIGKGQKDNAYIS